MGKVGEALESKDVRQIAAFYSPDTFSHAFELPIAWDSNAQEHRESLVKHLDRLDDLQFDQTDEVKVWKKGGKIWSLGGVHLTAKLKDGRNVEFDGRHSAIWDKQDGKWVMVHEHYWGPVKMTALAVPLAPPIMDVPPVNVPPAPAPQPPPILPPPPPVETGVAGLNDIFYDFDRSNVRATEKATLDSNAVWLKSHPNVAVKIEGHCDERGTRAYNIALGARRAETAKQALVDRGIPASRMTTVSYGKERPFELGHNEEAWAKNRRAHFVVPK